MNWSPMPLADVFMAMITMIAMGLLIGAAVSVGSDGIKAAMLLTSGVTVLAQCCLYWAIRDLKQP